MTIRNIGLFAALAMSGIVFAAPDGAKGGAPKPPAPTPAPLPVAPVAETVTAATPSDFSFDDVSMPEKAVGRVGGPREPSVVRKKLSAIPVGKSWLEPVAVADTITDAKERETAFKEAAKVIQNRIAGDIRRHKKVAGNELQNFSVLRVDDAERGTGVRIYRNADGVAPAPTVADAGAVAPAAA